MKNAVIARKALEEHFTRLRPVAEFQAPAKGWTRAIRDALGMTTAQLAARMGVRQPSLVQLEHAEAERNITLARLQRAAEALDCTLVYVLVSNRPPEEMVRDRARQRAEQIVSRVHKTMTLEAQNLRSAELAAERDRLTAEFLRENTRLRDRA